MTTAQHCCQAYKRWCGFPYSRCASTLQRDITRRVSFRLSQFQEASCQGKTPAFQIHCFAENNNGGRKPPPIISSDGIGGPSHDADQRVNHSRTNLSWKKLT